MTPQPPASSRRPFEPGKIERTPLPGQRQTELVTTLEKLLAIQTAGTKLALEQAAQLVGEMLKADKVDILLYDDTAQCLIAVGVSNTPLGHKERALGLDRLPLASGGRIVEVFQTGHPYYTGHADQDPKELKGITEDLGIRSSIAAPFAVDTERRGVLSVTSTTPNFFNEQDFQFVQAVAYWIGMLAHKVELQEQLTQEATERGRRLAAEELLTILAHDLRNYLTPIKGRVDILKRKASREQLTSFIEELQLISLGLRRIDRLMRDILDVPRLEQGLFSLSCNWMNFSQCIQETVTVIQHPQHNVQVQVPSELLIFADPQRIRQVLENLLSNACKHAPSDTPITILLEKIESKEETRAVLSLHNWGPPIPPELRSHLFEPFTRSPNSPGLGLGLYLVRKIVEAHGGTVTVESEDDIGTTFYLSFPLQSAQCQQNA